MDENTDVLIDISQLRIGMYIQLELSWQMKKLKVIHLRPSLNGEAFATTTFAIDVWVVKLEPFV